MLLGACGQPLTSITADDPISTPVEVVFLPPDEISSGIKEQSIFSWLVKKGSTKIVRAQLKEAIQKKDQGASH